MTQASRSLWLCTALAAGAASAQTPQTVVPGALAIEAQPTRQRIEEGIEEARWRWGKLRVSPRLVLREVGYDDNVTSAPDEESRVSDFRATVGAGLVSYLPLGEDAAFSAFAGSEYYWWQDTEALRELTVSAGAGVFAYFNRLDIELETRRLESETRINSESDLPVNTLYEGIGLDLEVRPHRAVGLFLGASARSFEHEESRLASLRLGALDRDEEILRGGVRVRSTRGHYLALGLERSDISFASDPAGRSSEGTSPLVGFGLDGDRARLDVELVFRDLEFPGADRDVLEETTGLATAYVDLSPRLDLSFYGYRNLVYSAVALDAFFLERRFGAGLLRRLGRRTSVSGFVETGVAEFGTTAGPDSNRSDDLTAFGVSFALVLGQSSSLRAELTERTTDSDLSAFDRSSRSLGIAYTLARGLTSW